MVDLIAKRENHQKTFLKIEFNDFRLIRFQSFEFEMFMALHTLSISAFEWGNDIIVNARSHNSWDGFLSALSLYWLTSAQNSNVLLMFCHLTKFILFHCISIYSNFWTLLIPNYFAKSILLSFWFFVRKASLMDNLFILINISIFRGSLLCNSLINLTVKSTHFCLTEFLTSSCKLSFWALFSNAYAV